MYHKKSLGQHFLTSHSALAAIVTTVDLSTHDTILEIGPGKGILTQALLATGARVIAVEKDGRLIKILSEKFAAEITAGRLILIHEDILSFAPETYHLQPNTYHLIANIPYYITGAIIGKFLSSPCQPQSAVLLIQKEVAERIVARDKKESLLSISVKAYGTPRYIKTVKAGSFSPPPKIDSAILAIEHISRDFFKHIDEQRFFEVVRAGFAHKRKRLAGNLRGLVSEDRLVEAGIALNARAEDLSMEKWALLT